MDRTTDTNNNNRSGSNNIIQGVTSNSQTGNPNDNNNI